jgi:PCRF domain
MLGHQLSPTAELFLAKFDPTADAGGRCPNHETMVDDCSRRGRITGRGAYSRLKFEGGVHRVQRVPATDRASIEGSSAFARSRNSASSPSSTAPRLNNFFVRSVAVLALVGLSACAHTLPT